MCRSAVRSTPPSRSRSKPPRRRRRPARAPPAWRRRRWPCPPRATSTPALGDDDGRLDAAARQVEDGLQPRLPLHPGPVDDAEVLCVDLDLPGEAQRRERPLDPGPGVEPHHDPGVGEPQAGEQLGELDLLHLGLGDDRGGCPQAHGGSRDDGRASGERDLDRRELEVVPAEAKGDSRVPGRVGADPRPGELDLSGGVGRGGGPGELDLHAGGPGGGGADARQREDGRERRLGGDLQAQPGLAEVADRPVGGDLHPLPLDAEVADGEPGEIEGEVGVERALVEQRLPAAGLDQGRAQLDRHPASPRAGDQRLQVGGDPLGRGADVDPAHQDLLASGQRDAGRPVLDLEAPQVELLEERRRARGRLLAGLRGRERRGSPWVERPRPRRAPGSWRAPGAARPGPRPSRRRRSASPAARPGPRRARRRAAAAGPGTHRRRAPPRRRPGPWPWPARRASAPPRGSRQARAPRRRRRTGRPGTRARCAASRAHSHLPRLVRQLRSTAFAPSSGWAPAGPRSAAPCRERRPGHRRAGRPSRPPPGRRGHRGRSSGSTRAPPRPPPGPRGPLRARIEGPWRRPR